MNHKKLQVLFWFSVAAFVSCMALFIGAAYAPHFGRAVVLPLVPLVLVTLFCAALIFAAVRMLLLGQKNERTLADTNRRYADLMANVQGGIITCLFDSKTSASTPIYIGDGWTALTGYNLETLTAEVAGNPQAIVLQQDRDAANRDYYAQTSHGNSYKLQYRIRRRDGSVAWVIDRGIIAVCEDGLVQNQSILTEVTEFKEKEEALRVLAQTDSLTGLSNKAETVSLSEKILSTQQQALHAMLALDIDNFKDINDTHGHVFGDTVLVEAATRLKRLFRAQDVVGRVGGDEFLVLMIGILSPESALLKAKEICASFQDPCVGTDDGAHCNLSCSIGIAFTTPGMCYCELIRKADSALYQAKTRGKNQFAVYSEPPTAV